MQKKTNYLLLLLTAGLLTACTSTTTTTTENKASDEVTEIAVALADEETQNTVSILSLSEAELSEAREASVSQHASPQSKGADVVSLEDVAQLVVHYHPRVAQSSAQARGEEEMIAVAEAGYYPQISAGMDMGYDQNASGAGSSNTRAANLEVTQNLYDFGKTANQVKSAELGFKGAQTQTTIAKEELVHTATTALLEAVRQERLHELSTQHVAQMTSLVQLVKERHVGGATSLSDVLHAESRLNDEKSAQLDLAANYDNQLQRLRILTGMSSINGVFLSELRPAFESACSRSIVWEDVPEYLLADLESKRAETEFDLVKSEQMPTISLTGRASRYLNNPDHYRSRNDSSIFLNVSVPVYQGGGLSARKRAYAEYALSASFRKEQIRLEIEEFMSESNISLRNMLSRQGLLEDRVKNLGGTRTLYKMQYLDLGTRSLVDLLNSEQEYHNARLAVENNELNALLMQLNCAYYHGKLSEYLIHDAS